MTTQTIITNYVAPALLAGALLLYFILIIKPNQEAKNKTKQDDQHRREIDKLFAEWERAEKPGITLSNGSRTEKA